MEGFTITTREEAVSEDAPKQGVEILNFKTASDLVTMLITWPPSFCSFLHRHDVEELFWTLKPGQIWVDDEGGWRNFPANAIVRVPAGMPHALASTKDDLLTVLALGPKGATSPQPVELAHYSEPQW